MVVQRAASFNSPVHQSRVGRGRKVMVGGSYNDRILVAVVVGAVLFIGLLLTHGSGSEQVVPGTSGNFRGSINTVWGLSSSTQFKIAVVADLDRQSKVSGAKKPTWRSIFKTGNLAVGSDGSSYLVSWDTDVELTTQLGEAGRGLELSELVTFKKTLLTFDDRSGIVFEIDRRHQCIPRYILTEGDGTTPKGQKSEWATVKDGKLYVGSFGKEYTNSDGSIANRWNLWIKTIDATGEVAHVDWTPYYEKIRKAAGASYPGYMIQEAIEWDPVSRHWFVLPRRVSSEPYDEKEDERKGSNIMMIADETFDNIEISHIGPQVDLRGWSSFKFVPGTRGQVIAALKTEEVEDKATGAGSQKSFFTVFRVDGTVLLEQTEIPGQHKYEGLAFL